MQVDVLGVILKEYKTKCLIQILSIQKYVRFFHYFLSSYFFERKHMFIFNFISIPKQNNFESKLVDKHGLFYHLLIMTCMYLFSAVRYGRVPKRSREQLESESKTVSAADSMAAATAVQVTTTTATTTTVAANAAAVVAAAVAIGIGGSAPAVADPIITGTGPAAVIETNGVSISYDVIAAISQAHLTNCDYTDELTRTLLRKPVASPVIISYDILY